MAPPGPEVGVEAEVGVAAAVHCGTARPRLGCSRDDLCVRWTADMIPDGVVGSKPALHTLHKAGPDTRPGTLTPGTTFRSTAVSGDRVDTEHEEHEEERGSEAHRPARSRYGRIAWVAMAGMAERIEAACGLGKGRADELSMHAGSEAIGSERGRTGAVGPWERGSRKGARAVRGGRARRSRTMERRARPRRSAGACTARIQRT